MSTSIPQPDRAIAAKEAEWEPIGEPDISDLVTEDETPVDNLLSEKQQRLLTSALYSSLDRQEPFLAAANVGLFYSANDPPLVPDVLLSFGVPTPEDWTQKKNRSYFTWNFGKPPDIVIEIVSNTVGNELGRKLQDYARASVSYYVVYDPFRYLGKTELRLYELRALQQYRELDGTAIPEADLGLTQWEGTFEGSRTTWLRWCDRDGQILLTGDEKADRERRRADREHQRAEQEHQRAERLARLLRERGIDPDTLD
ncbi:Uma2 family endonuclease [Baaleninema sp.]|uniref:Uma2 family endonuclease n=1 Tax=Baaleninema sp. TaxID=3101197 RepID=UPI003D0199FA